MKDHHIPRDFLAFGKHVGVKAKKVADFGGVFSVRPAVGTAIFTRNRYPGNPILVGRRHAEQCALRAVVVNSGNSNVATGDEGLQIVEDCVRSAASSLGIPPASVLPCSTGVIGRLPPRDLLVSEYGRLKEHLVGDEFEDFARAIMTTDTFVKLVSAEVDGHARILGTAKGAGMIEPMMATMLAFVFTDAHVAPEDLKRLVKSIGDRTFNRVSIDGDTSTSDTFAMIANGASGKEVRFSAADALLYDTLPDPLSELPDSGFPDGFSREFILKLGQLCRDLTRMIARDGEGGSKLIELKISAALSREQALKVGRELINSPLFKTAVRGADPNWGRIIMAIGNVADEVIPFEGLSIRIGKHLLDMKDNSSVELGRLAEELKGPEVFFEIALGTGTAQEILWGCDLTEEYVRVNAYYTT